MILNLLASATLAASAPQFVDQPCADEKLANVARCSTVEVPENRDTSSGRVIALTVIIMRATGPRTDLPPLFDIDGGPGMPVTQAVGFYLSEGSAYRVHRDIVLVDQRGTRGSNALFCPELNRPEDAYKDMLPPDAVARCRQELLKKADLTRYGTHEAVADLDAVRSALGYNSIDIFALSYGTTVALRYMATHPDRVRAAVLMGTAPPDAMPPRHHATAGERALNLLFEDCAADIDCRTAFPSLADDLDRALASMRQSGELSPAVFTEKLRSLMYSPTGARQIPWIINRAAGADLAPFYEATKRNNPSHFADGMWLSITCAESFGSMDYEEAARAARTTRFGDYRLRRQRQACDQWPSGNVAPDLFTPVTSQSAVLLISGRLDPVTPPEWAERVAKKLPNARHLIVPDGGHVFDGLSEVDSCFEPLLVRFYETGSARSLNVSCLAAMRSPPFKTSGAPN